MKSILLSAGMILLAVTASFSQSEPDRLSPKLGVKGGVNLSNLYREDVGDENLKVGLNLGLFAKIPVTEFFAVQPEVLYSSKGTKIAYNTIFGDGEYRFNLNYIEVPVLAVFNLGPNINIHAGPYAGFLASANVKDMDDNGNVDGVRDFNTDNFNRFDYGVAAGLGFEFGNFVVGGRYNYGLNEVGKSGNLPGELTDNLKNNNLSFYVGFGF